jgi:hypothetical protein
LEHEIGTPGDTCPTVTDAVAGVGHASERAAKQAADRTVEPIPMGRGYTGAPPAWSVLAVLPVELAGRRQVELPEPGALVLRACFQHLELFGIESWHRRDQLSE